MKLRVTFDFEFSNWHNGEKMDITLVWMETGNMVTKKIPAKVAPVKRSVVKTISKIETKKDGETRQARCPLPHHPKHR